MGVNERKEQARLIKENDILNAVERLFTSKGVDSTTMDDIAKEAEFSKRTLYVYFKNKTQLMMGLVARHLEHLYLMMTKLIMESSDYKAIEQLKLLGDGFIRFSTEVPSYYHNLHESIHYQDSDFTSGDRASIQCKEAGQKCVQVLIDLIKKGMEDGSMKEDLDPVDTAIILWSSANGVIDFTFKEGPTLRHFFKKDPSDIINKTLNILYSSIAKELK